MFKVSNEYKLINAIPFVVESLLCVLSNRTTMFHYLNWLLLLTCVTKTLFFLSPQGFMEIVFVVVYYWNINFMWIAFKLELDITNLKRMADSFQVIVSTYFSTSRYSLAIVANEGGKKDWNSEEHWSEIGKMGQCTDQVKFVSTSFTWLIVEYNDSNIIFIFLYFTKSFKTYFIENKGEWSQFL